MVLATFFFWRRLKNIIGCIFVLGVLQGVIVAVRAGERIRV